MYLFATMFRQSDLVLQYVGEEGPECQFKAAVFLSSPWNLDAGNRALQRTYIGKEIYLRVMGGNMKGLFNQHFDQISKNTQIDLEAVKKVKYLYDFDREVQGPTWGYPTEGAYYRDASSCDAVLAIRVPFLAIHARDDPVGDDVCLVSKADQSDCCRRSSPTK